MYKSITRQKEKSELKINNIGSKTEAITMDSADIK